MILPGVICQQINSKFWKSFIAIFRKWLRNTSLHFSDVPDYRLDPGIFKQLSIETSRQSKTQL